jgi:hypothetical protein
MTVIDNIVKLWETATTGNPGPSIHELQNIVAWGGIVYWNENNQMGATIHAIKVRETISSTYK